jgi:O-methyltransferase
MSEVGRRSPHVCQWINFLSAQYSQYRIIQELFRKANPGRHGMKDHYCVLTNSEEMLVMANQLYLLRSHGVEGAVLECSCFKGFSSCCLSIACRRLG